MVKSMHRSKIRYFYHIFVSPGDAPGAITLNVVRMEREFDACKLSRCMCPSNLPFLRYSEILVKKASFYHTPLHSTPHLGGFPLEYRYPLWDGKTRMVSLHDGEKISKIGCTVWPQCTRVTTNQPTNDQPTNQRPTTSRHSPSQ